MSFHQEDTELLDAYLRGELTKDQQEVVSRRLKEEPAFQQQLDELVALRHGIRSAERQSLRRSLRQLEAELGEPEYDQLDPKGRPIFRKYHWFRVAAGVSIFFAVGIGLFLLKQDKIQLDDYLVAYPNVVYPVERSGSNEDPSERALAYEAYDREQYELAAQRFSNLDNLTDEDQFYTGISLMLRRNYTAAADQFDEVLAGGSALAIPSRWYVGLCYLKLGDEDKAKEVLRGLIDDGSSYSKKAQLLLENLN